MPPLYRPLIGGRLAGETLGRGGGGISLLPGEEDSLIRSVASTAGSGFNTVGNFFDTPGAGVRDLLAFRNPLIGTFNPEQRTSGRDLLEYYHLLGANQPGLDVGDVLGFGVEVALDPLTYLSLGGSALSKAGRVAKNAGLLDDLARVVSRNTGKITGKRAARLTSTLDDLVGLGPTISRQKADDAARAMGLSLGDLGGEKLGGLVGVGLPFGEAAMTLGTGESALNIARKLDRAGDTLRYGTIPGTEFSPGSALARLFDVRTGQATSRVGQQAIMPELYAAKQAAGDSARGLMGDVTEDLVRGGGKIGDNNLSFLERMFRDPNSLWRQIGDAGGSLADNDPDAARALRRVFEGIDAPPSTLAPMFEKVWGTLDKMVPDAQEWGLRMNELIDPVMEHYFPRYWSHMTKRGRTSQVASTFDPSSMGRQFDLRRLGEGTDTFVQISRDPVVQEMVAQKFTKGQIAEYLDNKYGDLIPNTYARPVRRGADATQITFRDQRVDLARRLKKMSPAELESGGFGNHPMMDLSVRLQNGLEAQAVGKTILTSLADDQLMSLAHQTRRSLPTDNVPLGKVLKDLKYHVGNETEGAMRKFLELKGLDATPENVARWRRMPVPRELADDLRRYHEGFSGPKAVNEIIQATDSITNLWKAGVTTPWLAFHTRNLGSGLFQNWTAGMFSVGSVRDAHHVLNGQGSESLLDIPLVQRTLADSGLEATGQNAADVVRRLSYQFDVVGRHQGEAMATVGGRLAGAQGSSYDDVLSAFPGGLGGSRPFDKTQAVKKFFGATDDTTLNPLKAEVRGVGGAQHSTFGPVAAGQDAGYYVEGINRLSPFIDQLRKGVDPAEAARRVKAAQIDYSKAAHTPFQNEVVTRVMPFSRFTMGVVPYTIRQLWEKPGGRLAQTVRGVNDLSGRGGEVLPDYVAGTAAVPLGQQEDGSDRYLTGFGIMAEAPLGFLGGGMGGALLEGASQLNPMLKMPLEMATGETFFQRGPQGGRDLSDLDPTLGRTLTNVGNMLGVTDSDKPVQLPGIVEHLAGNSPLQRIFTTIRTATDPRKGVLGTAANLATGLRVSDVSPASQDAVLRERLSEVMRGLGAKSFERVYYPKEDLANLPPEQQLRVLQMQALMNLLAKKAKERKEAKNQATARRGSL